MPDPTPGVRLTESTRVEAFSVIWLNHHGLFVLIRRVDRSLLWLNLGILLNCMIIPLPTAVLADALRGGNLADPERPCSSRAARSARLVRRRATQRRRRRWSRSHRTRLPRGTQLEHHWTGHAWR